MLKELEKRNLRPPDIQKLLSIGEQHPDKQCQGPLLINEVSELLVQCLIVGRF